MVDKTDNKGVIHKIMAFFKDEVETVPHDTALDDRKLKLSRANIFGRNTYNDVLTGVVILIANAITQADIVLKKDGKEISGDDFSYTLKYKVARNSTIKELLKEIVTRYYLQSEVYLLVRRDNGMLGKDNFRGFTVVDPSLVTVYEDDANDAPLYKIQGLDGMVESHDMIHLKALTEDGVTAVNIKKGLENTTVLSSASDESYYNKLKKNNYPFRIDLKDTKTDVNDPDKKALDDMLLDAIDSYMSGDSPLVVPEKVAGVTEMKEDPFFYDLTKIESVVKSRIANAFNVPYGMLDTSGDYTGREDIYRTFINQTVVPLLTVFIDGINRKVLSKTDYKEGYEVTYNTFTLYRTDLKTLAEAGSAFVRGATLTPNEVRKIIGHESIEGGDELFVAADLIPVRQSIEKGVVAIEKSKEEVKQAKDDVGNNT